MKHEKYVVRLSGEERVECQEVIKKLKGSGQKVRRAQMLLKADVDGPGWTDGEIAEAFDKHPATPKRVASAGVCRVQTVEKVRKKLVTEGFEIALNGKKRAEPPRARKFDGKAEAKLKVALLGAIAMRLGKPPEGYGKWTLRFPRRTGVRWLINWWC